MTATLTDESGPVMTLLPPTCTDDGRYLQVTADLAASAGKRVTLTLTNHDDGWAGDATFEVDDVTALPTACIMRVGRS